MEDQIRRNNRIYKTKKSNLDRPSRTVAQRIEALSLYGSPWALSEDNGFNSYPIWSKTCCDRQLWKAVITGDTVRRKHSYPMSQLISWRRPEAKFGRNVMRKNNRKTTKMRTEVRNKKLILRLRSLISKGFPIKTNTRLYSTLLYWGEIYCLGICWSSQELYIKILVQIYRRT